MVKVVHLGAATALLICAVGVAATIPQPEGFQRFANELTRPWIGNVFPGPNKAPTTVLLSQKCTQTSYDTVVCEATYADTFTERISKSMFPALRIAMDVLEYLLSLLPHRAQRLPILLAALLALASQPSRADIGTNRRVVRYLDRP